MSGIQIIESILEKQPIGNGFWLGNPSEKAKDIYMQHFGIETAEMTPEEKENLKYSVTTTETVGTEDIDLAVAFGSDMIWLSPEIDPACWQHPERRPVWDCFGGERQSLTQEGCFGPVEDVAEIDAFDWPNPAHFNFEPALLNINYAQDKELAVFGGMWCPFFHVLSDFFGMENYFVKMHTHPEVVHTATRHVIDFYLEANKRCFDTMGDQLTAAFFGNDLGSQLSTLVSLDFFDEFIAPYMQQLIDQMKSYNLSVVMHSCGAIFSLIPRLIDMGVDALHPLQAKAVGMEPEKLQAEFGNDLVFIGGVDTQDLLPFHTADEVADEVRRLRDIFGDNFVVSPSHEALLENVSVENVMAMAEAAKE